VLACLLHDISVYGLHHSSVLPTIVDMPDRTMDLLFHSLHQNSGRFSKRAREKGFSRFEAGQVYSTNSASCNRLFIVILLSSVLCTGHLLAISSMRWRWSSFRSPSISMRRVSW